VINTAGLHVPHLPIIQGKGKHSTETRRQAAPERELQLEAQRVPTLVFENRSGLKAIVILNRWAHGC